MSTDEYLAPGGDHFSFATILTAGTATISPYPYSTTQAVPSEMTLQAVGVAYEGAGTITLSDQSPFGTVQIDAAILTSGMAIVRGYHDTPVWPVHAGGVVVAVVTGTVAVQAIFRLRPGRL